MAISTRLNQWTCFLAFTLAISVQYVYSETLIPKTVIGSAIAKGAVCLDGSPPAYNLAPGTGEGKRNWLIYLSGGGWCVNTTAYNTKDGSVETCANRAMRDMGSSLLLGHSEGKGIFSGEKYNTYFYNWNRVIVRYCDGGSFLGNADKPDPVTKLYYRGARIYRAVVEDLMAKGLKDAQNVILAGGSAGGIGVMAHCDHFRSQFPKNIRVKCLADSSLFLIVKNPEHAKYFKGVFTNLVNLHQPGKELPAECTSKMTPFECFLPQNLVQYVKSPLFIFNSAFDSFQVEHTFGYDLYEAIKSHKYISPSDMALLKDFRQQTIDALPQVSATKGYIISSRYGHAFSSATYRKTMFPFDKSSKSIESGFVDWYFDRRPVNLKDPSTVPFYNPPN